MHRNGVLVNDMFGPSIEGPADEIVNDAWDAETPAAMVKLARKALTIDLNAIDAYNILGIHASTLAERIALFREAVIIGRSLFEPLIDDEDMGWWGFMGTRPWMRAQHNLGLALTQAGDASGAIEVFKFLLRLNPNDNQGIRYLLLKLFAEAGNNSEAQILFDAYPADAMVEFPATKLLFELAKKSRKKDFKKLFNDVQDANPFVLDMLKAAAKGKWPAKPRTDYIAFGSKEQAAGYLAEFKSAWAAKPHILIAFLEEAAKAGM
jgi:tetratricopeptide (TPR) repeat protein